MGKAQQRRARKLARYLQELARTNPERFQQEWAKRLQSWAEEAHARGRRMRDSDCHELETTVFRMVNIAEELLAQCGPEAQRLVGVQTRRFLLEECARAFSLAVSPDLRRLTNAYESYLRTRTGSSRSRR